MEMAFLLFGLQLQNTLIDLILKDHCIFVLKYILMIKYFNMFLDFIYLKFLQ